MPHNRYTIRPNPVGRSSIIDIFTGEPVTIGHFHCINMHPNEAEDVTQILNDVDHSKRRYWASGRD